MRIATATLGSKSCCVHTTFLHCAHQTLRGFAVTEDVHLSQVMNPKYKHKFDESKNLLMRNGQANADSSGRKSVKKHDEQFTSSTHFRWCVRHDGDHESDDSASGICQQEATQCGRTVRIRRMWKHHLQNGISGVEHQKQNFWRCGTQRTWSNGKRRSLFVLLSRSVIQNRWDYHRQARDAVNQAVRESSENYEVRMMPEFQGAQHRYEGRRKWKKSDTSDWVRCTRRSTWSKETHVAWTSSSSSSRRQRKRGREQSGALRATVTHCGSRRSWHEREVLQERISQNWAFQQAQRRVTVANRGAHDDVSKGKFPRSLKKWGASCCQHNSWQFPFRTKCRRQRQSVILGRSK